MCNGHSTRVSQGGSIAVLRPTQHLRRSPSDDLLLFFNNRCGSRGTSIEFQGWNHEAADANSHWVVIHRDGDLSSPADEIAQNPLFSFELEPSPEPVMQLSQRLDLGVSDVGIIGRRVSVMARSRGGPLTVAQGIIGWN